MPGVKFARRMALLGGAVLLVASLTFLPDLSFRRSESDQQWVQHTLLVLNVSEHFLSAMEGAETSERGYLLTSDKRYLESFQTARTNQLQARLEFRKLTVDNRSQQIRSGTLNQLAGVRIALLSRIIGLFDSEGPKAAAAVVAAGEGAKVMQEIRDLTSEIQTEEYRLLSIRTTAARIQAKTLQWNLRGGGVFLVGLLFVCGLLNERDIGTLKRAGESLKASEEKFHTLANTIPQLCWMANADGAIFWYNDRWYEFTGTTLEAMEGWGWQSVHDPQFLPKVMENWTKAISSGEPFEMEFPLRSADGTFRSFLTRVHPFKDTEGRVQKWFGTNTDVHELKSLEESLRTSQARLASTLAAGSIGTWTWDIVNDRLAADEFTALMFSVEPEAAAKGLPADVYLRAVMEADRASVAAALGLAIQSCGHYDIEYRVRQTDGEPRWLQAKGRIEGDATGNALFFHGAVMDITERKRTEGRFRRLVESNAQGVMFWNIKGEITGANDAFLRMVGYTREDQAAGRIGWAAMTPPEYAHLDRLSLEELAATGICTPFEKEFVRRDGSRVPILLGAATFEDSPNEGVCFVIDITERKRTDQALRESEEHFRFLHDLSEATRTLAGPEAIVAVTARMLGEHLRASRCAYVDVDQEGERLNVVHDYSDGCASTVGTYQLSMFGASALDTRHAGQTLIIRDVEAELSSGQGGDAFRAIGIQAIISCPLLKDGSLLALMAVHQTTPRDWRPAEIRLVEEVVERCQASIERRTAEEAVRLLNADLEQRVMKRTAEAGAANIELAAANKELSAFAYSVSHDLRAPLRGIDGWSLALLEDYGAQLDDRASEYLARVRSETQRMGSLIDDMLLLSRVTRDDIRLASVDLTALAHRIAKELLEAQPGRSVKLVIAPHLAAVGDVRLLSIALTNLFGNALKFTVGRGKAHIEFGKSEKEGDTVFYIRDNGVGFDMAYARKLFGAFQRMHKVSEFAGTGIGLAIVQRVVTRHGGRVWAEARVNEGATFSFTLGVHA